MSTEIAIIDANASFTMSVKKPEKTGSLARAIAFADSASRKGLANAIYLKQLSNGQFRPLARDIVDTLVPKSAQPSIELDGNTNRELCWISVDELGNRTFRRKVDF